MGVPSPDEARASIENAPHDAQRRGIIRPKAASVLVLRVDADLVEDEVLDGLLGDRPEDVAIAGAGEEAERDAEAALVAAAAAVVAPGGVGPEQGLEPGVGVDGVTVGAQRA